MLVIATIIGGAIYALGAIEGETAMNLKIFFGWFVALLGTNGILFFVFWVYRDTLTLRQRAAITLWVSTVIWYWLFAPIYFVLNLNFNTLHLSWAAFEFFWEVSIIGALFIGYCIYKLKPITQFYDEHIAPDDPKHIYDQTIQYPIFVSITSFIVTLSGYTIGGLQSFYLADLPKIEFIKTIWEGVVISLFLTGFYYLFFDLLLNPVRGMLENTYQFKTRIRQYIHIKIFAVTLVVGVGSIGLLSLSIFQSSQIIIKESMVLQLKQTIAQTKTMLRGETQIISKEKIIHRLKIGPRGTVVLLDPKTLIGNDDVTEETIRKIAEKPEGMVEDFKKELKLISFFEEPTLGKKVVATIFLTDFYDSLSILAEFFIGAGLFVLLLTVGIITFMSFVIARSIRNLATAVRSAKAGAPYIAPGIHTADEVEDLSHAFTYYVTHAEELQTQLRGAIDALGNKVHDLEITKRTLKGTVDDLARTKDNLASAKTKDEALLESIGDGMLAVDEHGKVLLMNRRGGELLHMNEKTVEGASWQTIIHELEDDGKPKNEDATILTQTLQSQQLKTTVTRFGIRPNGSIPVAVTAAPVITNNTFGGVIMVFRDITKEQEVDKAKNEFVSLASHQLRTPLSTINWYAEMLGESTAGKLSKKQRGYVDAIATANQRMVELVNALLNVSRIELGTISIEPELTDLKTLGSDIAKIFHKMAKQKGVTLIEEYDKTLIPIMVDQHLMHVVLQNLLSNAIKYTPKKGGVEIAYKRDAKHHTIVIEVKDTGYGIPKNEQSKISTKLFRAENIQDKETNGTGLGLYIVKSVIEHAGGTLNFTSKEGVGSTFWVTIPEEGMTRKEGVKGLIESNR